MANLTINSIPNRLLKRGIQPSTIESSNISEDQNGNITIFGNTIINNQIINKTYSELTALKNNNQLAKGSTYFLTDKNIYLYATEVNNISTEGVYKATNADHDNATGNSLGIWSGTITIVGTSRLNAYDLGETITGATSGAQGVIIVEDGNVASTIVLISKNGITFQNGENISGNVHATVKVISSTVVTSATTATISKFTIWNNTHYLNTTGSGNITHPIYDTSNWTSIAFTDISYQIEYDPIIYDFVNDRINERRDKRGNTVTRTLQYLDDIILTFQWGRNTTRNNTILDTQFYGSNARTAQQHLFIQDSRVLIYDTRILDFSVIMNRCTVLTNGSGDSRAMNLNAGNVTVIDTGVTTHLTLERFASALIQGGCSFTDNHIINAIVNLTGTSQVFGCKIDGGRTGIISTFASEDHTDEVYIKRKTSTFIKALSITNATTTLALTGGIYGIYQITSTGGVPSIDTITGTSDGIISRLLSVSGTNNLTFIHGGTLQIRGAANKTLNCTKNEWIEVGTINGVVVQEYNSGQY